jgi:alpha-galactosidase
MEALRVAMGPDVTLLGCGAPFGSSLGLVEAMRIGPDVSGDWAPTFNGIKVLINNEPSFPCARNSIRNILTRANLHGHWWVNDPDCLLIRPDSHLTLNEVKTLCTAIGMTGGSMLLSDDLPKLPVEHMRLAEALLPVIGERAQVVDWFDAEMPAKLRLDLLNDTGEWHLLARFNWQDSAADLALNPVEFDLPAGEYRVRDFWHERTVSLASGESYVVPAVPAHGCVLCAFRAVQSSPQYLGGTIHYSMGKEVADWQSSASELAFTLRLPRTTEGKVSVAVPWELVTITCDENLVEFTRSGAGVVEFPVVLNGFCRVKISQTK